MHRKDPLMKEKAKMLRIIDDLKEKMAELDELKEDIEFKDIRLGSSLRKSRAFLEEIKVPPLEILKEGSAKK